MSKSAINNPFLTELKDKNGESWYHQIILEEKDKEIERLNNIIKEVREYIGSKEHYEDDFDTEIEKVYKILDKGDEK